MIRMVALISMGKMSIKKSAKKRKKRVSMRGRGNVGGRTKIKRVKERNKTKKKKKNALD